MTLKHLFSYFFREKASQTAPKKQVGNPRFSWLSRCIWGLWDKWYTWHSSTSPRRINVPLGGPVHWQQGVIFTRVKGNMSIANGLKHSEVFVICFNRAYFIFSQEFLQSLNSRLCSFPQNLLKPCSHLKLCIWTINSCIHTIIFNI